MTPIITIYTDGSALGNPGPGGYGVVLLSGPFRKELSEGYRLTTNNRMELTAVIRGLEQLKEMGFKTAAMALTDDSVSIDDPDLQKEESNAPDEKFDFVKRNNNERYKEPDEKLPENVEVNTSGRNQEALKKKLQT